MSTIGHTPAISSACCSIQESPPPTGVPNRSRVVGAARTRLYEQEAEHRTGLTDAEFWQAQAPVLEQLMLSGRYPLLAGLPEDAFGAEFDHFEFGLQCVLDGLETLVTRRRAGAGAKAGAETVESAVTSADG